MNENRQILESALDDEVLTAGEHGIGGTCECGRPRSKHVIIAVEQLETAWELGICATICAHVNGWEVAVWVHGDSTVEHPCDQEFMEAISS